MTWGAFSWGDKPFGYVPVNASAPNIYVLTPSGSVVFSGTTIQTKTKTYAPSGTVVFSGSATEFKTKTYIPSGAVVFSGSAPLINPNIVGGIGSWRTLTGAGF